MSRFLILGAVLIAVVAFAGTRPTGEPQPVHAATVTPLIFTGFEQTFTVPAGVTRVAIEVRGARGANGCNGIIGGGNGGEIFAIIPVTGIPTLFIEVGGNGAPATLPTTGGAGGFNGGGAGGSNVFAGVQLQGGGGGGATDVRTISSALPGSLASRLIVAGGGGGGGGCGNSAPAGPGASGGIAPALGDAKGLDGSGVNAGLGGISGSGGGAGGGAPLGVPGTAGVSGVGGNGGGSTGASGPGGAGGGGGGGALGGGGGGSQDNDHSGSGGGGGGAGSNQIFAAGGVAITGGTLATTGARIIVLDPPTITKSFSPATVAINGVTNLTITLANPNPAGGFSQLTGIAFTDNFAAQGLVITTGVVTGTPGCGVPVTAAAGTSVISATGITLAAGATCQITVEVRATLGGAQVNTTGAVSAAESGPGGTANATLQVANTIPAIAKSFNPTSVVVGNTSALVLTLANPNIVGMTGAAFTDNFAAQGLVITSAAATGTPLCTGTITAAPGTSLVSLTGGTLAANSSCQIVVTVRANNVGTQVNTTSTLTSTEFAPAAAASATLVVTAAVVPTATPTPIPTVVIVAPPPVIPQVFQHLPQGIFNGTRNNTPTPVRQAVAPSVVIDPGGIIVISPPRTGDAGLVRTLRAPFAW